MSHYCCLVINTPSYKGSLDDALAKYDEKMEVDEYASDKVTDMDKIDFLDNYVTKDENKLEEEYLSSIVGRIIGEGDEAEIVKDFEEYMKEFPNQNKDNYHYHYIRLNTQAYADFWKKKHPKYFANFEKYYNIWGKDWDGNSYRKDENGEWKIYTTYNPNSKWDWFSVGGRWSGNIKTTNNEHVNKCLLSEIDWSDFKDEDYDKEKIDEWTGKPYRPLKEGVHNRYTKSDPPYAVIIDGEWYSKGKMGWFAISFEEKTNWIEEFNNLIADLPGDSEVYNVDLHI